MGRFAILFVCCLAVSCGNASAPKEKNADSRSTDATKKEKATPKGETRDAGAAKVAKAPAAEDDPRQAALVKEFARYDDEVLEHSADELTEDEKSMMRHLLKASKIIEQLYMTQLNPSSLGWRKVVDEQGTEIEKKIFARYQHPWCGDDQSPECCAVSDMPKKEIGLVHWPKDFSDAEYEKLGAQINGDELTSPFTTVKRGEGGRLVSVPYSQTEEFGPLMKELAGELRAAAQTAPHPSLKKFLKSRADALLADKAYPYDQSDYDWIAVKGDWEVTVGPYETYKNPRQLKALFEMYIGREDKKITAELAQFKENLQAMEDALGQLVGPEIYKSRKLDPRIAIRAIDVWVAAGDGRKDRGVTVAFHLPNRGPSVDEGLYKKVMMVNHSMAFEPISKARAGLVLDESQLKYVDAAADIKNVTFHEFAHGFGAYHEMKVINPKGKETTVKEALKEHDSLLEELKADVFGMWLLSFQKKKGWVDEQAQKTRYASAFMHVLGLLQYPLPGTYPRMVAIQLGWYMDAGAVTWDADLGRFSIVFEKMPAAVESLAKHVATIQLTGDYNAGAQLVDKYMQKNDKGEYELKGVLGEARTKMMAKFEEAGIRSPSLRYKVNDL